MRDTLRHSGGLSDEEWGETMQLPGGWNRWAASRRCTEMTTNGDERGHHENYLAGGVAVANAAWRFSLLLLWPP